MGFRFDTFLFDLDGTLLDTHADMANALNITLDNHGKSPLPIESIRPFVSKGGMVMVCMAFRCKPGSDESMALWKEFLEVYANHICIHTAFFPGMDLVIQQIEDSGRNWGIVTNKPGYLTASLLQALELDTRVGSVVSGDTLPQKKPHPAPVLLAAKQNNSAPERCLYVGDDERDIQAGKSAGMVSLSAAYGYIVEEDDVKSWGADGIIYSPIELTNWLD